MGQNPVSRENSGRNEHLRGGSGELGGGGNVAVYGCITRVSYAVYAVYKMSMLRSGTRVMDLKDAHDRFRSLKGLESLRYEICNLQYGICNTQYANNCCSLS